jgi:hypothetical protein
MSSYEPQILEEFAEKLYKEAGEIISSYCVGSILGGGFLGLLIGAAAGFAQPFIASGTPAPTAGNPLSFSDAVPVDAAIAGIAFAALGGILGYYWGKEKAFELKLKAQQALCQLQIEKNTRPPVS